MRPTPLHDAVASSRKLRDRTREAYLAAIDKFVEYAGPDPSRWTGKTVEDWRDRLASQGLKPQSVNAYVSAVKFASKRHAELYGLHDFARAAEMLKREKPEARQPLTLAQARALLGACEEDPSPRGKRDKALLTLALRTGLRSSEIRNLKIEDIRGNVVQVILKGGRYFRIPLDREAMASLEDWISYLRTQGITSGPVFRSPQKPSLEVTQGRKPSKTDGWRSTPLSSSGFHKILVERTREAGLRRKITPHIFRHTFVTWSLQQGAAPEEIRRGTGHLEERMLDVYSRTLERPDEYANLPPVGSWLPPLGETE